MKVEIFTFCDFSQDNAGKLTVVGSFDTIYAKAFPVVYPLISIVSRIRFSLQEKGRHTFRFSFMDMDGFEVFPAIQGEAMIEDFKTATSAINLSMNVVNAELKKECIITARLEVDGKEQFFSPLHLVKAPIPPSAPRQAE